MRKNYRKKIREHCRTFLCVMISSSKGPERSLIRDFPSVQCGREKRNVHHCSCFSCLISCRICQLIHLSSLLHATQAQRCFLTKLIMGWHYEKEVCIFSFIYIYKFLRSIENWVIKMKIFACVQRLSLIQDTLDSYGFWSTHISWQFLWDYTRLIIYWEFDSHTELMLKTKYTSASSEMEMDEDWWLTSVSRWINWWMPPGRWEHKLYSISMKISRGTAEGLALSSLSS